MNYQEAIAWLYDRVPSYQHKGVSSLKKYDLSNIKKLCQLLGNPHNSLKVVHIAGTNGKGSVSHMLASILQKAGYQVGLYTSPHLLDFRERVRVNGLKVPQAFVLQFISQYRETITQSDFSFFEISVAIAFSFFAQKNVDFAVIEVGLGGRLDSTNIVSPILTAITNVSLDHEHILGDSIAKIAWEKSGIIKPLVPVVVGEMSAMAIEVIQKKCREMKAPLVLSCQGFIDYKTDMEGEYQKKNLKIAVALAMELRRLGVFIEMDHIESGLKNVSHTGLRGRWQIIQRQPLVVYDVAHNEEAFAQILPQFEKLPHQKKCLILGFTKEKNTVAILQKLLDKRLVSDIFLTKLDSPRSKDLDELDLQASRLGLPCCLFDSFDVAYREALEKVGASGVILVAGSFLLAEGIFA